MSIYDTTALYGLSVKAVDDYMEFFRAIAVAIEACHRNGKPEQKESALQALKQSSEKFSDLLLQVQCVCNENINQPKENVVV